MGLCDTIIQYYCDDSIRDGETTETIPFPRWISLFIIDNDLERSDSEQCGRKNCDMDQKYGMHENSLYFRSCIKRYRNKNLFISTQNLKGHSARYTRQNNNGKVVFYLPAANLTDIIAIWLRVSRRKRLFPLLGTFTLEDHSSFDWLSRLWSIEKRFDWHRVLFTIKSWSRKNGGDRFHSIESKFMWSVKNGMETKIR